MSCCVSYSSCVDTPFTPVAAARFALGRYFTEMARVIEETNGCLVEFIGDAILAIWNAPIRARHHATLGVDAALAMRSSLARLRAQWAARGWPKVDVRCGLHTATVFVGNIGAPGRMKYGVMGDGVNLASRLEELNKLYGTRILISDVTARAPGMRAHFLLRPVDFVAVKGRSSPVMVHEVVGRHPTGTRATSSRGVATHSTTANSEGVKTMTTAYSSSPPHPPKTNTLVLLCETHAEAMVAYLERDFTRAAMLLRNVEAIAEKAAAEKAAAAVALPTSTACDGCDIPAQRKAAGDIPAALLRERCEFFALHPPPADWNGCQVLTQKSF